MHQGRLLLKILQIVRKNQSNSQIDKLEDLNSSLNTHVEERHHSVRSHESNKLKPVEVSDDSSMEGELTLR